MYRRNERCLDEEKSIVVTVVLTAELNSFHRTLVTLNVTCEQATVRYSSSHDLLLIIRDITSSSLTKVIFSTPLSLIHSSDCRYPDNVTILLSLSISNKRRKPIENML